eukprot:TRINITY_DN11947_c0_g1_i1.p1 TRINITY_DN11947_c0_g1~~TRINITY_DN11947_c0_g1_i1.p1  ORF type:complete len:396 (+),score=110.34 TRINITY_DN11947_c0_g1_i1:99-1286(+)
MVLSERIFIRRKFFLMSRMQCAVADCGAEAVSAKGGCCAFHAVEATYGDGYDSDETDDTLSSHPSNIYISPPPAVRDNNDDGVRYQYGDNTPIADPQKHDSYQEDEAFDERVALLMNKLQKRPAQSSEPRSSFSRINAEPRDYTGGYESPSKPAPNEYEYSGKLFPADEEDEFYSRVEQMIEKLKTPLRSEVADSAVESSFHNASRPYSQESGAQRSLNQGADAEPDYSGRVSSQRSIPYKVRERVPHVCPVCDLTLGIEFDDASSAHVLDCLERRERRKRAEAATATQSSKRSASQSFIPQETLTRRSVGQQKDYTPQRKPLQSSGTPEQPRRTPVKPVKVIHPQVHEYQSPTAGAVKQKDKKKQPSTKLTWFQVMGLFFLFLATMFVVLKMLR